MRKATFPRINPAPQIDRHTENLLNSAGIVSPKAERWESWVRAALPGFLPPRYSFPLAKGLVLKSTWPPRECYRGESAVEAFPPSLGSEDLSEDLEKIIDDLLEQSDSLVPHAIRNAVLEMHLSLPPGDLDLIDLISKRYGCDTWIAIAALKIWWLENHHEPCFLKQI